MSQWCHSVYGYKHWCHIDYGYQQWCHIVYGYQQWCHIIYGYQQWCHIVYGYQQWCHIDYGYQQWCHIVYGYQQWCHIVYGYQNHNNIAMTRHLMFQQKIAGFKLSACLNELIDEVEQLYNKKNRMLIGADKLYFNIIENCIDIRSVSSFFLINSIFNSRVTFIPCCYNFYFSS